MPELPDLTVYLEALRERVIGRVLDRVRWLSPFVLRSTAPPVEAFEARKAIGVERLGKRLALGFDGDLFVVIHLMVAGRLRWRKAGAKPPGRIGLAAFDFRNGSLLLTETSRRKRASVHLVAGREALESHRPAGLEVLEADLSAFRNALTIENHTLKRALTNPRLFSGIGNAYSDEILHRAKLSPFKKSGKLSEEETARLYAATRDVLAEWIDRLRAETGNAFPEKVTAFRPEMAVHGRYGKPCPNCGTPVRRIVYSENESNYCSTCQTGGRVLADRALSRLLGKDWPRGGGQT